VGGGAAVGGAGVNDGVAVGGAVVGVRVGGSVGKGAGVAEADGDGLGGIVGMGASVGVGVMEGKGARDTSLRVSGVAGRSALWLRVTQSVRLEPKTVRLPNPHNPTNSMKARMKISLDGCFFNKLTRLSDSSFDPNYTITSIKNRQNVVGIIIRSVL